MIDTGVFIRTMLCVFFMFAVLVIIITLKYKYQHPYINILSFAGLLWLVSGFLLIADMTSFQLKNYEFYGLWSRGLFVLGWILMVVTLISLKIKYKDNLRSVIRKVDYKNIFHHLEVLTIITDLKGKILIVNNQALFDEAFDKGQTFLDQALFRGLILDPQASNIYKKGQKSFLVMMSMIKSKSTLLGYLFSIDDISLLETQKETLKAQNQKLQAMNVLIEETAAVKSKLSVEQERLKVLNRIQKDLMSHIERIVLNLEIRDDQPLEVYRKKATDAAEELRKVYKRIREVIREMKGDSNG